MNQFSKTLAFNNPTPTHATPQPASTKTGHPNFGSVCCEPKQKKNIQRSTESANKSAPTRKKSNQKSRQPFRDPKVRKETALTRNLGACARCKFQKIRCVPRPSDPGVCTPCYLLATKIDSQLPCIRDKITEAFVYREQQQPFHLFTQRWDSMALKDITSWRVQETKTIKVTQFKDYANGYELEVREFLPQPGDMVDERWTDGDADKRFKIPPYAIADIHKAARDFGSFIDSNIANYILKFIPESSLISETYLLAFKHMGNLGKSEEALFLLDVFRQWVVARKTSNPEYIYGEETLGLLPTQDSSSPFCGRIPIPPMVIAQSELIQYSTYLRPLSKSILSRLQKLMTDKRRKAWLTVYFATFILLHSCAMITRRDEEYATQVRLRERYANPKSIKALHHGAIILLAHFHHCYRTSGPSDLAQNPSMLDSLMSDSGLEENEINKLKCTFELAMKPSHEVQSAREKGQFGNDYYFISQLFDKNWSAPPIYC